MHRAAVLASLCALGLLGGCEKLGVSGQAEAAAPAIQAQPVSVQKTGAYDFDALVAEGMARDKAVFDSGWKPRKPQAEPAPLPTFMPAPAPAASPRPAATAFAAPAPPADIQVFDRGGRGGRVERGGGRGGGGRERNFGGAEFRGPGLQGPPDGFALGRPPSGPTTTTTEVPRQRPTN